MTNQLELVQGTSVCFLGLSCDTIGALPEGCAGPRSSNICTQLETGRNEDQCMFSEGLGLREEGEREAEAARGR